MNDQIAIHVLGDPMGQPRGRAFVGPGGHARIHEAGTAEAWKSVVAAAVIPCLPGEPWPGPIKVHIHWLFSRPKSHFGTGRNAGKLKASAPVFKSSIPDIDNCEKAILDCLTRLRLWQDDAQVAWGEKLKLYCDPGERPGMLLAVVRISDDCLRPAFPYMIPAPGPQDAADATRPADTD